MIKQWYLIVITNLLSLSFFSTNPTNVRIIAADQKEPTTLDYNTAIVSETWKNLIDCSDIVTDYSDIGFSGTTQELEQLLRFFKLIVQKDYFELRKQLRDQSLITAINILRWADFLQAEELINITIEILAEKLKEAPSLKAFMENQYSLNALQIPENRQQEIGRHVLSANSLFVELIKNITFHQNTLYCHAPYHLPCRPIMVDSTVQQIVSLVYGVHIINLATNEQTFFGNRIVQSVFWNNKYEYIATVSRDVLQVWNIPHKKIMWEMKHNFETIHLLEWGDEFPERILASAGNTLYYWDIKNSRALAALLHPHDITEINQSAKDSNILACSDNHAVYIWNMASHECTNTLPESTINLLSWHHTRDILAGATKTNVYVWNSTTGERVAHTSGHNKIINSLNWHPTNPNMLMFVDKGTVCVWDITMKFSLRLPIRAYKAAWHPTNMNSIIGLDETGLHEWDLTPLLYLLELWQKGTIEQALLLEALNPKQLVSLKQSPHLKHIFDTLPSALQTLLHNAQFDHIKHQTSKKATKKIFSVGAIVTIASFLLPHHKHIFLSWLTGEIQGYA